ncbi:MAG: SHOCT-like domain-containing protein [Anaerolineae bacterium]
MATTEERMQILNMVAEGKISAEEGAKLLSALEPERKKKEPPPSAVSGPSAARWFRVRVTDLETGKNKVNVNLPMSLVDVGTRMGARFAPELEDFDFDAIIEQVKSGAQGKIIEVEDSEGGERVEIYVE